MIYAIISDIHANLEALERVIADARRCGAERFVCLGDVAGIGPRPIDALARIREIATIVLKGDHDEDANLPYTAKLSDAAFVHGDMTDPSAFKRIDSCAAASANFSASDATILFVGHTHVPQFYLTGKSGEVYSLRAQDFALEPGRRYIVDVGSVGYPQETEGQYRSSYVLYDENARSVVFRSIPFNMGSLIADGAKGKDKKSSLRAIGGAVIAAMIVGGVVGAVAMIRPRLQEKESSHLESTMTEAKAVEEVRELRLTEGQKRVHANLMLERKSDAAMLVFVFSDAVGGEIKTVRETVRSFSKKGFVVPEGACAVRISVASESPEGRLLIRSFEPTAK